MTQPRFKTDEYVIPRGIAYFDIFDDNGNLQGEIDLGNTSAATVSGSAENLEHFSSRGGLNEKDRDVPVSVNRTFSLTVDTVNMNNISLFLIGSLDQVIQANTPVVDEVLTVKLDHFYQLGQALNPAGVRNVTAVVVQDVTDTTTYVLDTDYALDAAAGRIQILDTGSITEGEVLHVDYTPAAETRDRVQADTKPKNGQLRIVADNPEGGNKDYLFPSVAMRPSGDMPIITSEASWASMQFEVGIQKKDTNTPAFYIEGRAIA